MTFTSIFLLLSFLQIWNCQDVESPCFLPYSKCKEKVLPRHLFASRTAKSWTRLLYRHFTQYYKRNLINLFLSYIYSLSKASCFIHITHVIQHFNNKLPFSIYKNELIELVGQVMRENHFRNVKINM